MPLGGVAWHTFCRAALPLHAAAARTRKGKDKDMGTGKACSVFGASSHPATRQIIKRLARIPEENRDNKKTNSSWLYILSLSVWAPPTHSTPHVKPVQRRTHTKKSLSPPWTVVTCVSELSKEAHKVRPRTNSPAVPCFRHHQSPAAVTRTLAPQTRALRGPRS